MLGITQGGKRNSESQPNISNQRESGTEIPNTGTSSALGWVRPWAPVSVSHRISVKSLLCELKVAPLFLQSLNPGTATQTREIPRSCLSYSCPWRSWAPQGADRATQSLEEDTHRAGCIEQNGVASPKPPPELRQVG